MSNHFTQLLAQLDIKIKLTAAQHNQIFAILSTKIKFKHFPDVCFHDCGSETGIGNS
jgi:hypothetical protein